MIVGTLENCEKYYAMGDKVKKAFEWLKNNDITTMDEGRYELDGDNLFVLVQNYTTRLIDDCWFEGHLHYVDIHYVAKGVEYFCYTPLKRTGEPVTEYDNVEDDYLYHKDYETAVMLKEGDFVIVYPEDVHMPQRRALFPSDVVKACIKISV